MKQIITLILMVVMGGSLVHAQIQLEKGDLPKKGVKYPTYQIHDSMSYLLNDSVSLGSSGANGIYDFNKLNSFGHDTFVYRIADPVKKGFDKGHPGANGAMWVDAETKTYRDPLKFDKTDLPDKASQFQIKQFQNYNPQLLIDINSVVSWSDDGLGAHYDYTAVNLFDDTSYTVEYLDASNTHWASKYGGSRAARLIDTETDSATGDTLLEVYEFYDENNGNFTNYAIGVKLDESFFTQSAPTGKFVYTDGAVIPNRMVRRRDMEPGMDGLDSSIWSLSAKSGLTEIRHTSFDRSYWRVHGTGVMYLPRDSFQVTMLIKRNFHYGLDSILVNNILVSREIDTSSYNEIQYFTRGIGEPLVSCYASRNFRFIGDVRIVDTVNTLGFTKERTDTVNKFYSMMHVADDSVKNLGLTAILDQGGLFGDRPSGKFDTLFASFDKPSLVVSTDFANGFSYMDTNNWSVTLQPDTNVRVQVAQHTVREIDVDGYGVLHLNGDTVNVLRSKVTETNYQTNKVYVSNQLVQTDHDTDATYLIEYWSKKNGMPVVRAETSEKFDEVWSLEYTDKPIYVGKKSPAQEISVYPNPAGGHLMLNTAPVEQRVTAYNTAGQIVSVLAFKGGQKAIATDQWDSGVYILEIVNMETSERNFVRVIIQH